MRNRILFFTRDLPIFVLFFLSSGYASYIAFNPEYDSIKSFTIALGILVSLSGICFSYSRNLNDDAQKRHITYIGERFLHAVIFTLLALILKFFIIKLTTYEFIPESSYFISIKTTIYVFISFLNMMCVACIMYTILDTHSALKRLNKVLWKKLYDEEDWDTLT